MTLNAAMEAEAHDGATNNTLATAQDITASFVSLGEGAAERGAVAGNAAVARLAKTSSPARTSTPGPPLGPSGAHTSRTPRAGSR